MNGGGRIEREVVVVGGGPAGAAIALHLARAGRAVTLLERRLQPGEKPCGEFLSPDCLRRLDSLGALPQLAAIRPQRLRGMRIRTPGGAVLDGEFPGVSGGNGTTLSDWAGGLSVSRPVLDRLLLQEAERAGVEVRRGIRVIDLIQDGSAVTGVRVDRGGRHESIGSRLVIGADGRHSVVAGILGWRRPYRRLQRIGFILRCEGVDHDGDRGEVLLGNKSYCILNPLGGGRWTIGLVMEAERARRDAMPVRQMLDAGWRRFPRARAVIDAAARCSPIGGTGPLAFGTVRQAGDGVVLVGDAAGFYDPLTGEGIHVALRGAELATEVIEPALRAGDLSAAALQPYEWLRRQHLLPKRRFCGLLQLLIGWPAVLDRVAAHLNRVGPLRETFMAVIGDRRPAADLLDPGLFLG